MAAREQPIAAITFNDLPAVAHTRKYEALGAMALANRRQYCERDRYTFIDLVAIDRDRPACWAPVR
jgi:hypothetical protein